MAKPSPIPSLDTRGGGDTRAQRANTAASGLITGRPMPLTSKSEEQPQRPMTNIGGGFLGIGDDFHQPPVSRPLGARDLLGSSSGLREDGGGGRGGLHARPRGAFGVGGGGGGGGAGVATYPPDPDYSSGTLHPSVLSPAADAEGGDYGGMSSGVGGSSSSRGGGVALRRGGGRGNRNGRC